MWSSAQLRHIEGALALCGVAWRPGAASAAVGEDHELSEHSGHSSADEDDTWEQEADSYRANAHHRGHGTAASPARTSAAAPGVVTSAFDRAR